MSATKALEQNPHQIPDTQIFEERDPFRSDAAGDIRTFALRVAPDVVANAARAVRLVHALSAAVQPVALEFVGALGRVTVQLACRESDAVHVRESVAGYLPEAALTEEEDLLAPWDRGRESLVIDFGLSNEFFLPLQTFPSFSIDPYIALLPALAQVSEGERLALQVLFARAANPWGKATFDALTDGDGGSLFADAPEFIPLAKEKFRTPVVSVVLRLAAQAEDRAQAFNLARAIRPFLLQFSRPGGNELIPLANEGYGDEEHLAAFLARESHRTGMLLSVEELVGFVHVPDASVGHAALRRSEGRTKALAATRPNEGVVLGENVHRGKRALVQLTDEERLQHVHIVGASGTGKSTLLLQLIAQDLDAGHGLAVLDPHGDLIDDVLSRVPEKRLTDVVVFDPADEEWPVGLNVFAAQSSVEKQLLASDLVGIFQRLSTSWGDTMGAVLGNAVLAILESDSGGTLIDLRRFLLDDDFRKRFLETVADEEVRFFWNKEYPLIGARSVGPILTRLNAFLRSKLIRGIVGQREPRFRFASLFDERKVFLGKLSQGLIGEENASLLGSLIATKLHQLALARQRVSRSERTPFFLYADEFQHFVTPSMASLLTEGRKYGLGLILAHQNLSQVRGSPVEGALLGNAYTRVVFRVGDEDARRLEGGFSFFEGKDLQGLKRGEAIVRLGTAQEDANLTTLALEAIAREAAASRRQTIIKHSREAYAVTLADLKREAAEVPESRDVSAKCRELSEVIVASETKSSESEPLAQGARLIRPVPEQPPTLGRGGAEHKYLQHLIKRLGEERGFRATIEESLGDGKSVDVVLRRDSVALAFEISVTSEIDHELENLRKCAGGGYSHIIFVASSKRKRDQVARAVKETEALAQVQVLAPEGIVAALDALPGEANPESVVRGYKVKISRQALAYGDAARKRTEVAQIVAASLTRQSAQR